MRRGAWFFSVGLLLLVASAVPAADTGLAGNWKLTLFMSGQSRTLWLVGLEQKGGNWTGKMAAAAEGTPPAEIQHLHVGNGEVRFHVTLGRGQALAFVGRQSAKEAGKILGTLDLGGRLVPAELEKTTLKTLDAFDLAKEELSKHKTGPQAIDNALTLILAATEKKVTPAQVKDWAAIGAKAAEPYGPTMQSYYAAEVASNLFRDKALRPLALDYAQQSRKQLSQNIPAAMQQPILVKLLNVYEATGDKQSVQAIGQSLRKIQSVETTKYPGRKANGNRVVLVELFTGAQCPPCVAADLAFDGLTNTFKPSEVVFLQYHLNVPGPDPLNCPGAEERLKYYEQDVQGTPTLLLNGKLGSQGTQGGGSFSGRQTKYEAYYHAVVPLLDQTTPVSIKADAMRQGAKITITAETGGVPMTKDPLRLRLAVVEKEVYYTGTNGITADRQVVRTFAGGAQGFALTQAGQKQSATVDVAQLRKELETYQKNWVREHQPYPGTVPTLQLKDLEVIAFVQNDKTKQILQAMHVPVRGEAK